MTIAISMLDDIFLVHTKHKIMISSIRMYYAKCRKVNNFPLEKLLMVTNNILLAINRHDTWRPLSI